MQYARFHSASSLSVPTRSIALIGLAFAACAIAGMVSWGSPNALLVWPGAAVVFVSGWLYGSRWMVPALLGTGLWVLIAHERMWLVLVAILASGVGPAIALTVLKRLSEWKPVEHRLEAMLRFLIVALLIAAPLDALIATVGLSIGWHEPLSAHQVWLWWWVVDGLGMVLFGTAMLAWLGDENFPAEHRPRVPRSMLDGSTLAVAFALAGVSLFLASHGQQQFAHALLLFYFPLVAWSAARNGARATVQTVFVSALPVLAARAYEFRLSADPVDPFRAVEASVLVLCAAVVGLVLQGVASDRRHALARVARQAREDMSTGLLNDRGLLFELGERLAEPQRRNYGLVGVHLSNFDAVTDLCGTIQALYLEQATAALLLRQPHAGVAARLSSGRYVLVVDAETVAQVRSVARELYAQLNGQIFRTENGSLRLQACAGGLLIDSHAVVNSEDCLTSLADAMAIAASVREPQLFVEPLSQVVIDTRRAHQERIEHIREAIREQRVVLYAQPVRDPETGPGRLSYEILARLRDRDDRLIPPAEFIPLAQQAQIMTALDRAVIQHTFSWLSDHPQALASTFKCSINLSGMTLSDATILQFIRQQRSSYGIPADKIVFEITESEAIRNPAAASRLVDDLKAEGIGIALDDFGTGLATFEYLKRFPLDYLKIDGQFIRNLAANPIDEEIVLATIRVARRLGVRTVAEHVHSEELIRRLEQLGIDCVQGNLIGVPVPLSDLFAIHDNGVFAIV